MANKIDAKERFNSNHAVAICNLIIEQQISFRAAITIKSKFKKLIGGLSNSEIINLDNNQVQSIGLSFRKVEYMKNVLIFFEKNNHRFENSSNDEVFEKIVKVCFSQRRKKVKNNLDQLNINTISLLKLSNIDPDIRAENIDIEGFIRISRNYEELIKENYEDF